MGLKAAGAEGVLAAQYYNGALRHNNWDILRANGCTKRRRGQGGLGYFPRLTLSPLYFVKVFVTLAGTRPAHAKSNAAQCFSKTTRLPLLLIKRKAVACVKIACNTSVHTFYIVAALAALADAEWHAELF